MKSRTIQRINRRKKHREEALEKYSSTGYKDLTAYNAVQKIRTNGQSNIVLK